LIITPFPPEGAESCKISGQQYLLFGLILQLIKELMVLMEIREILIKEKRNNKHYQARANSIPMQANLVGRGRFVPDTAGKIVRPKCEGQNHKRQKQKLIIERYPSTNANPEEYSPNPKYDTRKNSKFLEVRERIERTEIHARRNSSRIGFWTPTRQIP
jgi:hypothetical protein